MRPRLPQRLTPALLFTLLLLAGSWVAWGLGWVSWGGAARRALPAMEVGQGAPIGESTWRPGAVYGNQTPGALFRKLATRGSRVQGDDDIGPHTTGWYRGASPVVVMVAGYPTLPGNELTLEAQMADGSEIRQRFSAPDPGERWLAWRVELPADTVRLRLVGTDGTRGARGWLGFSEPFGESPWDTIDLLSLVRTLGTVALTVTLVLGPGVLWQLRRGPGWLHVLWPGPLLLATMGLLVWWLGGGMAPGLIARALLGLALAAVSALSWRARVWERVTGVGAATVVLSSLCLLGAAAKAAFSGGPAGELYGGQVSRTLEIGGHADSRIAFHTVQMIAHHLAPHEPVAAAYLAPWNFSSRGPLSGLAAAPIVLGTGGRPPLERPDEGWTPWDRQGFAAYRIAMMGLAVLALHAVVALLLDVAGARRAALGASLVALAPFFWHELYFSWPKLITAAWVLGAFAALRRGHAGWGGLWLGGAYLMHPLALLSAPFFGLWCLLAPLATGGSDLRAVLATWRVRVTRATLFSLALLGTLAAWRLLNTGHHTQAGFLDYFRMADNHHDVTAAQWWLSRWRNLTNTLVPLHVWLFHGDHPSFTALGARSDRVTQFFLLPWATAPFAVGIVAWLALLPAWLRGLWRQPTMHALALGGPFLLLVVYWGAATTGLMREAGHVLFLTGWVLLVWSAADALPRLVRSGWWLTLRGGEVWAMMFVPALIAGRQQTDATWALNDAWWLAIATGGIIGAVVCARRCATEGTEPPEPAVAESAFPGLWPRVGRALRWSFAVSPEPEPPMPGAPPWSRREFAGTALGVVVVWLAHIFWPAPPHVGLDPSWQTVLQQAWTERWQWGRDLVFTAGPWGWLLTPVATPETLTAKLWFELVGKLGLCAFGAWALRPLPTAKRWGIALVSAVFGPIAADLLPMLVILAAGVSICARPALPRLARWSIAGLLAWLALAKLTLLFFGLGVIGLALLGAARRRAWTETFEWPLAYAAMLLGSWWAAGQNPAHLFAHLHLGLEIARGYATAMQQDEPRAVTVAGLTVAFTLLGLLLVLGATAQGRQRHGPLLLLLAGTWWIAWRQGFVRADGHVWVFFVLALAGAGIAPGISRAARLARVTAGVGALAGFFATQPITAREFVRHSPARLFQTARRLGDLGGFRATYARAWASAAQAAALPRLRAVIGDEAVDVANYHQSIVALNGLRYRPRPVPQSYVAYTPRLAQLNADFYYAATAPRWLLWRDGTVDHRYPTAEDPLAVASWLTHYEPTISEGNFQLWWRRETPAPPGLPFTGQPLLTRRLPLDEMFELPIPANEPVWVTLDWQLSFRGRLRALLYRAPVPFLVVRDSTGTEHRLRLLSETARAPGFLLSPYLPETADFVTFATQGAANYWVQALRLESATPDERKYWHDVEIRLVSVRDRRAP